jgi:hypothetical protein
MRSAWTPHTKTDRGTIWRLTGPGGAPVLDEHGEPIFKHVIDGPRAPVEAAAVPSPRRRPPWGQAALVAGAVVLVHDLVKAVL